MGFFLKFLSLWLLMLSCNQNSMTSHRSKVGFQGGDSEIPVDSANIEAVSNLADIKILCPEGMEANPAQPSECLVKDVPCSPGTVKNPNGDCIAELVCPGGGSPNPDNPTECLKPFVPKELCEDGTEPKDGICHIESICPEGSEKTSDGKSCLLTAQCPSGASLDPSDAKRCIQDRTFCPEGSKKNIVTGTCDLPALCPGGQKPDALGLCLTNRIDCPEGSSRTTPDGPCLLDAVCPSGSALDPANKQLCLMAALPAPAVCPEGSEKDPTTGICQYKAQCPAGSTLDADHPTQCVLSMVCSAPGIKNPTTGACELTPQCSGGSSPNPEDPTQCVIPMVEVPVCPTPGVKNATTGACELPTQCPVGSEQAADGSCVKAPESCDSSGTLCLCPPGSQWLDGHCLVTPECPEGASLVDSICLLDANCPPDSIPNPQDPKSCLMTNTLCPVNSTLSQDGICLLNTQCPSGSVLDPQDNQRCLFTQLDCPEGASLSGQGLCLLDAECPQDSSIDPTNNQRCLKPIILAECPGVTNADGACERPSVCPPNSTALGDLCLISITQVAVCPSGSTTNPATKNCELKPQCPPGTKPDPLDPNQCFVASVQTQCPQGSTKIADGVCQYSPKCLTGTLNPLTKSCEINTLVCAHNNLPPVDGQCVMPSQCPKGTTYSSDLKACLAPPQCPSNTFQTATGCMLALTCPNGNKPTENNICLGVSACANGMPPNDRGECIGKITCENGSTPNVRGECMGKIVCPEGTNLQTNGSCLKEPDVAGVIAETFSIQNLQQSTKLDLIITVDCSSSMGDEIRWLKEGALAEMLNTFFKSNSLDPALVRVYLLAYEEDSCGKVTVALHPKYQPSLKVIEIPVDSEDALKRTSDFIFNRKCSWDEDKDCTTAKSGEPYHSMSAESRKEILIISDDESNETAQTFVDKIRRDETARKNANLPSFGIEGKTKVNGFIIINENLERPGCDSSGSGIRYLDFAKDPLKPKWGGQFYDLCGKDFTTLMTDLGKGIITSINQTFVVKNKIDTTKAINLYVNGVAKIKDTDFFVNIEKNEISIDPKRITLIRTDSVKIEYYTPVVK
jgi:hypothetical protein